MLRKKQPQTVNDFFNRLCRTPEKQDELLELAHDTLSYNGYNDLRVYWYTCTNQCVELNELVNTHKLDLHEYPSQVAKVYFVGCAEIHDGDMIELSIPYLKTYDADTVATPKTPVPTQFVKRCKCYDCTLELFQALLLASIRIHGYMVGKAIKAQLDDSVIRIRNLSDLVKENTQTTNEIRVGALSKDDDYIH